MSNCTDITEGNGFSESKESEDEQTYILPSWRVNEIIFFAVQFLSNAGFWEEGFDYRKVIMNEGIVIKAYSAFKSENLLELQKSCRLSFMNIRSLAAGNYSVSIVTKPGNTYFTANIDSEVTVA
ncbi:MAG: hypothetical protein K6G09_10060 [Treponema sp.]|nr:hypothetical protein [Treponema sp.]